MTRSNDDKPTTAVGRTPQPLAEVNKSRAREHHHDPDLGKHGPIVGETAAEPTDRHPEPKP